MMHMEIIAVCSEIHTKHINILCGQNVELYVKSGGSYNNRWAWKSYDTIFSSVFEVSKLKSHKFGTVIRDTV